MGVVIHDFGRTDVEKAGFGKFFEKKEEKSTKTGGG